jgi:hypothetical protein
MAWRAWAAAAMILAAAAPLGAGGRLSMRVSPSTAFAPANLVVRAMVEHNEENRAIEIIAESEDFYRSSEIGLDGANAPRTTLFEFRSLPTGFYEVRAVLKGVEGREIASTRTQLNIVGNRSGY